MQLLGEKYRITILTDRLIRLEYSEQGYFEDSPTFAVVNRNFGDDPEINVNDDEDDLTVETKYLFLSYDTKQFSSIGLLIKLKETGAVWNFGEAYDDFSNLGGTARTLDDADGRVRLEKGIFGRNGYAVIDDSRSPVFDGKEFVKRIRAIFCVRMRRCAVERFLSESWYSGKIIRSLAACSGSRGSGMASIRRLWRNSLSTSSL